MNKYLIVQFEKSKGSTYLSNAYIVINDKKKKLNDLEKIVKIINGFDGSIYNKIGHNTYIITDKKVINKITSNKVVRRNQYVGVIMASTVFLTSLGLVATEAKNFTDNQKSLKEKAEDIIADIIDIKPVTKDDEIEIIENNETKNDNPTYDNVISFSYTDRTSTETFNHTREQYSDFAYDNSIKYGIDYKLVMAIISQENPYNKINNSNIGANGVMQIESIWYDENIKATYYNDEKGSLEYETVKIDKEQLSNPEYSIKIGCMILNNYFETLYRKYVILDDVLTESECIEATIRAYNKGITSISNLINEYGKDYNKHIEEVRGGDNEYLEHVASYIKDGDKIQFRTISGTTCSSYIDNLNVETFKR